MKAGYRNPVVFLYITGDLDFKTSYSTRVTKWLGINLNKKANEQYNEKYKTLRKK